MSRGRGRGRGRGKPFAHMEGIGLAPGAAAPPPILKPPPLFPILERKPSELKIDEVSGYLYSIKQEFRQCIQQSPFYLKTGQSKASVDRYSDKYQDTKDGQLEEIFPWKINWNFFPPELQLKKKVRKKIVKTPPSKKRKTEKRTAENDSKSTTPQKKKRRVTLDSESSDIEPPKEGDVLGKLKELDKPDRGGDDEQSGEEGNPPSGEEEYYDEEIEEEGTDYNQTYFDNGEEFIEEDDNLEDNEGPYY